MRQCAHDARRARAPTHTQHPTPSHLATCSAHMCVGPRPHLNQGLASARARLDAHTRPQGGSRASSRHAQWQARLGWRATTRQIGRSADLATRPAPIYRPQGVGRVGRARALLSSPQVKRSRSPEHVPIGAALANGRRPPSILVLANDAKVRRTTRPVSPKLCLASHETPAPGLRLIGAPTGWARRRAPLRKQIATAFGPGCRRADIIDAHREVIKSSGLLCTRSALK